jgi:hypothetical protein
MWEFVNRNLFYLQGQATVNLGIAMLESFKSPYSASTKSSISTVLRAIPKLEAAKDCVSKMKSNINIVSPRSLDEASDLLKADQVECLASRWIGKAHWMAGQQDKAIGVLQTASQLVTKEKVEKLSMGLEEDVLDLVAECLFSLHTIADVACSQLEELARSSPAKGDLMVDLVKRTVKRHCDIMDMVKLQSDNSSVEQFLLENDIPSAEELTNHVTSVMEWWTALKERRNRPLLETQNILPKCPILHRRSDLSSFSVEMITEPSAEAIKQDSKWHSRQQQQQRRAQGQTTTTASHPIRSLHAITPPSDRLNSPPTQYRPWGDELFWMSYEQKHENVANKSTLPYPSCAPLMPEEFL